jgi:hypothetical protein
MCQTRDAPSFDRDGPASARPIELAFFPDRRIIPAREIGFLSGRSSGVVVRTYRPSSGIGRILALGLLVWAGCSTLSLADPGPSVTGRAWAPIECAESVGDGGCSSTTTRPRQPVFEPPGKHSTAAFALSRLRDRPPTVKLLTTDRLTQPAVTLNAATTAWVDANVRSSLREAIPLGSRPTRAP